ncbi:MAG: glycine zipper 2TM domain-containing protein [Alcaligenaceae bacterium]|nr:glycine zipper 2TM domain-containing protein [Alcaligenaceae bacterium]
MNIKNYSRLILVSAFSLVITGCAYHGNGYSGQRTTATVGGAALGGLAGAALTDGDPVATVGGAAIGGLIGNQLYRDDDRSYRRGRDRDYRRSYNNRRYYDDDRRDWRGRRW